jgi:transcriptional regulator with XRE-family HTH domain
MDIRSIMKAKGFTLDQIAEQMPSKRNGGIGITRGAVSQMVNGQASLDSLRTIAKILGCKIGDFFRDEMSADNSYGFDALIDNNGSLHHFTSKSDLEEYLKTID